jgi:hypothetical protein
MMLMAAFGPLSFESVQCGAPLQLADWLQPRLGL